jgi:hypothetical protein
VTIAQRINESWKRDGVTGMLQRTEVYLLRRLGWRTEAWSRKVDYRLNKRNLLRQYGSLFTRNEIFRNRHQGGRCFVIGNGPSLNQQDLAPLADEITFAVNHFDAHPIISPSWQPTYYCLSDPIYFDGTEPVESLRDIAIKIPSAPVFVPHYAREFLTTTRALPEDRTYYVGLCGGTEQDFRDLPDFTKVVPAVQTVVQLAVMAAMFMGCARIYLLGMDHDWLAQFGAPTNFYSNDESGNQPQGNWTYKSLMIAVVTRWNVHEMLRRIAEKNGIEIVNATHGGLLDVFERARYEDVISS